MPDPTPQVMGMRLVLQLGQVKGGSQVPVVRLFHTLKAKLAAVINGWDAGHGEQ